jgi:hypothetical protein
VPSDFRGKSTHLLFSDSGSFLAHFKIPFKIIKATKIEALPTLRLVFKRAISFGTVVPHFFHEKWILLIGIQWSHAVITAQSIGTRFQTELIKDATAACNQDFILLFAIIVQSKCCRNSAITW